MGAVYEMNVHLLTTQQQRQNLALVRQSGITRHIEPSPLISTVLSVILSTWGVKWYCYTVFLRTISTLVLIVFDGILFGLSKISIDYRLLAFG